nr:NADH dehydrogenase subunit 2 [Ceratosolen fusciceps]
MIFFNYYIYIIFMPLIFISSILSFISMSWFSMWMLMELSLVSFIYIMYYDELMENYVLMNYYLIQTFSSFIFLFSSLTLFMFKFNTIFMFLSLMIKMGIPPFHFWYLKMFNSLNWINIFVLSTIQKIIPLVVMSLIIDSMMLNEFVLELLKMVILIGMLLISMLSLNQITLKMIMSFSSIVQMNWMLMLMFYNEIMLLNYFLIYSIISLNLCLIFYKFNLNNINDLYIMKINPSLFYFLMMSMFSLMGIPPFFGFLVKWISLKSMVNLSFWMMMVMIYSTIISVFIYMRLLYSCMMNYYLCLKNSFKLINLKNNFSSNHILLNWISMMSLFLYECL